MRSVRCASGGRRRDDRDERDQGFQQARAELFRPEKIILFGSYAYGNPTEDSDVDILVVMPHKGASYLKASEISTKVRNAFPMDLLVRSPAIIRQRIAWNDFFLREITEKGKVLYDAAREGVGRKGRRGPKYIAARTPRHEKAKL